MSEIALNKVIIELVKQFSKPIIKGAKSIGKDALDKLSVNLNTCFTKYLERNYDRYSKTKTLLYREAPVNIKDFYVRTDLLIAKDDVLKESDFIESFEKNQRVVVTGTAGSGKSTFCKSIFIDLIDNPIGVIPIFIELRHLNTKKPEKLLDYAHSILAEIEPSFSKRQLEYSLKLGKIMLIFDGFDEINSELRDTYEEEIINLSGVYHNILILISSRPDTRFSSWEEFFCYEVLPLDKEKAVTLIGKLEYDRQVKRQFLEALENKLYYQHKSFARNPLLLTMMLLTYEQIAEIPNKIHLFYEQAFLTLFNKHDSLKSLYKRKSFSGLPLDDFKKLLSSFCILSYSDRKYFFTEDEINQYLKSAIHIAGIETNLKHFLTDILDSVCIMQRDGLGYTFTHRSFQEYFTALYLVGMANQNRYKIYNKIAFLNNIDDVIPMIFDINSDLLEQEWVIPRLEELILDFATIPSTNDGKIIILSKMYDYLIVRQWDDSKKEVGVAIRGDVNRDSHINFIVILHRLYHGEMNNYIEKRNYKATTEQRKIENELIQLDIPESGLNIRNISTLREETKSRIIGSGICESTITYVDYARFKLDQLKEKHKEKQFDLSNLLLNEHL
ncbi:NACHT domain-containing protein [Microbulbifer sp. DLAB2-AA]|uniref:NACHT domain-containing protein n=1 Tax=Microbulbifer sp. DLAB2-AA TaxID=3243394 RepID=UPI00403A5086